MSFQWFEKEDQRKAYRASVGRDGKLRLGKPLRQVLPRDIQVGFDRTPGSITVYAPTTRSGGSPLRVFFAIASTSLFWSGGPAAPAKSLLLWIV